MPLILLLLALGLAHAHPHLEPSKVNGDWRSVFIAADNETKIEEGGPLRAYFRTVQCQEECNKLQVKFYVKSGDECQEFTVVGEQHEDDGVFVTDYSGKNYFKIIYLKDDIMVFHNRNVDEEDRETRAILAVGRAGEKEALTEEEQERFSEIADSEEIPKENIRELHESDTCPE